MLPKRIPAFILAICFMLMFSQAAVALPDNQADASPGGETTLKKVQVFDVAAGKVIKSIPNDSQIQTMAASWLHSITGLAPQITSDESCNYVYRVPLAKPTSITINPNIVIETSDLFLFYCKNKPPLLLVFDSQRKPFLFLFSEDITPFLKKTGTPSATNG